ncbi:MAG: hypothetical protein K1Y36_16395 [Blastocatellia bacterium]|nr:hypothetical protein [Blastocatellia bacterium]
MKHPFFLPFLLIGVAVTTLFLTTPFPSFNKVAQASAPTALDPKNKPRKRVTGTAGVSTQSAVVNFLLLAQEEKLSKRPQRPKDPEHPHDPVPLLDPAAAAESFEAPAAKIITPRDETPRAPSPATSASFLGLDDNNGSIPPDTHGAVGPNHVMVTLNTQIRILSRTGTAISTVSLDSFWSRVGGDAFDPKVLYDPFENRWMITSTADGFDPMSAVLIGVSQTSDPTGNWNLYRIDADKNDVVWADYPSFGFNKDWIVVTCNMFGISTPSFRGTNLYIFNKADLYAKGTGKFTLIQSTGIGGTVVPAITYDNSLSTLYLVQGQSSGLGTYTISGPVGQEVLTVGPTVRVTDGWSFGPPNGDDFAPQQGTPLKISNGDARIQNVFYRNQALWCAHTVFTPAGAATRSAAQIWQIRPEGSVVQRMRLEDPTSKIFYAYPTLAVNKDNDLLVGYSRFSASQFASANYAFRAGSDPLNTLRDDTVLKEGEDTYFKRFGGEDNRWGDYSSTIVDPVNDTALWTVQEYAGKSNRWGVWVGQITPPAGEPLDQTPPTVKLGFPVGGETFKSFDELNLTWTASDNKGVFQHDLAFSTDGGATFPTQIAVGLPGTATSFKWSIPQVETTQGRIQITTLDTVLNRSVSSNATNFIIVAPSLPIPRNLSATVNGALVRLNWDEPASIPTASLRNYNLYRSRTSPVELSGGNRLGTFTTDIRAFSDRPTPADGKTKYFYVLTGVYESGESAASNEITVTPDASSGDPTAPTVRVLTPNGGETVTAGDVLSITWTSTDNVGVVSHAVDLSTDNGNSFTIPVATGLAGTVKQFSYTTPTTVFSTSARIRVQARDAAGNTGQDSSDGSFTLKSNDTEKPTVTVTSPGASTKKLVGGAGFSVTWTSGDNVGVVSHQILLSRDDGATFPVTLADSISGSAQSVSIVIPNEKIAKGKIKVVARDTAGNVGEGVSSTFKVKQKK